MLNAEFMNFTTNISDVYAYGFVLIPEGRLDQLARALPPDQQRDTGGASSATPARRQLSDSLSAVN